jgi:hypothetical protein
VEVVFGIMTILLGVFLGLSPWTYGFADHPVAVIDVVAFGSVAVLVGTFDLTSTRVFTVTRVQREHAGRRPP